MMVVVQAIRFFSNFSLSAFLAGRGRGHLPAVWSLPAPSIAPKSIAVSRLVAQDAALYIDILLASDRALRGDRATGQNLRSASHSC